MNLFALLLGLGIERLLTHFFHLREFRWLDPLFDRGFAVLADRRGGWLVVGLAVFAVLLALPVALVALALDDRLFEVPRLAFSVLVLLFSLGPRDLAEEVDDYRDAVAGGDTEEIRRVAKEIAEREVTAEALQRDLAVEQAVYVQANNRIFGVVFWFLLLGPTGAWWFRILDLMRRRVAFRCAGGDGFAAQLDTAARIVHGVFAWVPARLLAAGYALAGHFEQAIADWRGRAAPGRRFFDVSNAVLARAGSGALGRNRDADADADPAPRVGAAMRLVFRTLWLIWCPVIAVLTLYQVLA